MTELERARIEARAAVGVAEEKLRVLREARLAAAMAAVDRDDVNELCSPGWNAMMAELDKLPDVNWATGCFYLPDGDDLTVFWGKPSASRRRWVNPLVSLMISVEGDEERIVGCVVDGAKGVLERGGAYLTPDQGSSSSSK